MLSGQPRNVVTDGWMLLVCRKKKESSSGGKRSLSASSFRRHQACGGDPGEGSLRKQRQLKHGPLWAPSPPKNATAQRRPSNERHLGDARRPSGMGRWGVKVLPRPARLLGALRREQRHGCCRPPLALLTRGFKRPEGHFVPGAGLNWTALDGHTDTGM